MKECDYGCGREGVYKMSSGKMCCEPHYNKCPNKGTECSTSEIANKSCWGIKK
jgi:hypothetical protein